MARVFLVLFVLLSLICCSRAQTTYTVVNSGSTSYTISPGGTNPTLSLNRGYSYVFEVSSTGHPFWIKTEVSTGTGISMVGLSTNGIENGNMSYTVPYNAENVLYYNCEYHTPMHGTLNILGQSYNVSFISFWITNNANNYLVTNSITGTPLATQSVSTTLIRCSTYNFLVNTTGHVFWIKTASGTGITNIYSDGITNNGIDQGIITWTISANAPSTIYFNSQTDSSMTGNWTIVSPSTGCSGAVRSKAPLLILFLLPLISIPFSFF